MSDLVQADIFFFITSIAVILLTLGILIFLYYAVGVARDVRAIVAKVRKAGEEIEGDFEVLRTTLQEEGTKGKMLVDLGLGFITKKLTSLLKPRAKRKSSSSEE